MSADGWISARYVRAFRRSINNNNVGFTQRAEVPRTRCGCFTVSIRSRNRRTPSVRDPIPMDACPVSPGKGGTARRTCRLHDPEPSPARPKTSRHSNKAPVRTAQQSFCSKKKKQKKRHLPDFKTYRSVSALVRFGQLFKIFRFHSKCPYVFLLKRVVGRKTY